MSQPAATTADTNDILDLSTVSPPPLFTLTASSEYGLDGGSNSSSQEVVVVDDLSTSHECSGNCDTCNKPAHKLPDIGDPLDLLEYIDQLDFRSLQGFELLMGHDRSQIMSVQNNTNIDHLLQVLQQRDQNPDDYCSLLVKTSSVSDTHDGSQDQGDSPQNVQQLSAIKSILPHKQTRKIKDGETLYKILCDSSMDVSECNTAQLEEFLTKQQGDSYSLFYICKHHPQAYVFPSVKKQKGPEGSMNFELSCAPCKDKERSRLKRREQGRLGGDTSPKRGKQPPQGSQPSSPPSMVSSAADSPASVPFSPIISEDSPLFSLAGFLCLSSGEGSIIVTAVLAPEADPKQCQAALTKSLTAYAGAPAVDRQPDNYDVIVASVATEQAPLRQPIYYINGTAPSQGDQDLVVFAHIRGVCRNGADFKDFCRLLCTSAKRGLMSSLQNVGIDVDADDIESNCDHLCIEHEGHAKDGQLRAYARLYLQGEHRESSDDITRVHLLYKKVLKAALQGASFRLIEVASEEEFVSCTHQLEPYDHPISESVAQDTTAGSSEVEQPNNKASEEKETAPDVASVSTGTVTIEQHQALLSAYDAISEKYAILKKALKASKKQQRGRADYDDIDDEEDLPTGPKLQAESKELSVGDSKFKAYAAVTKTPKEKDNFLKELCSQKDVSKALRRVVAWRIGSDINDNDGWDGAGPEQGAGSKLRRLLEHLRMDEVTVLVTRQRPGGEGGKHMGADRFKKINEAAKYDGATICFFGLYTDQSACLSSCLCLTQFCHNVYRQALDQLSELSSGSSSGKPTPCRHLTCHSMSVRV
eukprot:m.136877 g.136877  ORF g.136877 m.136877 type:complete len:814 (+) comp16033_c0_seq19:102-2543(+)